MYCDGIKLECESVLAALAGTAQQQAIVNSSARMKSIPLFGGGGYTLARGRGGGGSQFGRGDRHCGTLGIYVQYFVEGTFLGQK